MTTISVYKISQEVNLKRGYITLVGSTGIHYQNPVLYIPVTSPNPGNTIKSIT